MDENIVKRVCKELGITQKQLAERIGVHDVTVRNWSSKGDVPDMVVKYLELLLENEKNKEIVSTLKKLQDLIK